MCWYPEIWAAGLYIFCGIGYWFLWFIDLTEWHLTKHLRTLHHHHPQLPCLHGEICTLNHRAWKAEGWAYHVFTLGRAQISPWRWKNTPFPQKKWSCSWCCQTWTQDWRNNLRGGQGQWGTCPCRQALRSEESECIFVLLITVSPSARVVSCNTCRAAQTRTLYPLNTDCLVPCLSSPDITPWIWQL